MEKKSVQKKGRTFWYLKIKVMESEKKKKVEYITDILLGIETKHTTVYIEVPS